MTLRALVTDAEERSALAACRALARTGYLVSTVATSRPALAHWSRCNDERLHAPDPRRGVARYASTLHELVEGTQYAVLMPGSDASLVAISEHRAQLEPHVRIGLPDESVVERALDKIALVEAATAAGLAAPATAVCEHAGDALAHAEELGFPVIVKPRRSFLREGDGLRQLNAEVPASPDDLARTARRFGTPFVIQRYERGPVLSCSGVVTDDGLPAFAVARYVRTWPVDAGPSSYSETIEPPPGLRDRVGDLLERIEWRGIFQLQLLELDDRLATLDLNVRIFGSLQSVVAAGANLPALWADALLGRRVEPVTARAGVRYRWEEGDAKHLLVRLGRRELAAAAAVLRPRRRTAHAYFQLQDPLPVVAGAAAAVTRRRRRG